MNIILCTDCGKIMSRYTLKCTRCNRDNLETFKDINSPQLKTRMDQLKLSRGDAPSSLSSAFFVVFIAVVISLAAFGFSRLSAQNHAPSQTAATSAAVTH
ncbi:MAG TPA: hypothetical protein V6C97_30945 [Oculatellaceae cyanobacterium]